MGSKTKKFVLDHLNRWVHDEKVVGQLVGYSDFIVIIRVDSPAGWGWKTINCEDHFLTEVKEDDRFAYLTTFDVAKSIYGNNYAFDKGCVE